MTLLVLPGERSIQPGLIVYVIAHPVSIFGSRPVVASASRPPGSTGMAPPVVAGVNLVTMIVCYPLSGLRQLFSICATGQYPDRYPPRELASCDNLGGEAG